MEDQDYISQTQGWIQSFVIGLDLCPFAALPMNNEQVLFVVNQDQDNIAIANHVLELVLKLGSKQDTVSTKDADLYETAFLITPTTVLGFEDFYEVTQAIQQILDDRFNEQFVLVAFHPEFRYQGHESDDTTNATNRSPYPMIHILKESSLTFAAESTNIEQLVDRNRETLSAMSWDRIKRLSHNN